MAGVNFSTLVKTSTVIGKHGAPDLQQRNEFNKLILFDSALMEGVAFLMKTSETFYHTRSEISYNFNSI